MYARFFTKALADVGVAPKDLREPFRRLFTQGMVRMGGGKMSKSKGNVVAPEAIIDEFGADSLRLAILQVKPPEEDVDWEDFGLEGCDRFLQRLWRLAVPESELLRAATIRGGDPGPADAEVARLANKLVADVTDDFGRWAYNVAVARAMAFLNELYRYAQSDAGIHGPTLDSAVDNLLLVLAPATPHVTAELWARRHGEEHIHELRWPEADESMLVEDTATMVVQVNGKVRDRIEVPADADEAACVAAARASEKVATHLDGEPGRVIARPPKLVNFVL
jgi:leucyl-tRNA synthetase